MEIEKDEVINSLKKFKRSRDAVLLEDVSEFDHHIVRFFEYLEEDKIAAEVLRQALSKADIEFDKWWEDFEQAASSIRSTAALKFPENPFDELLIRYSLSKKYISEGITSLILKLGIHENFKERYISLILRPFFQLLGDEFEKTIELVSEEERALQAIPYDRIPKESQVKNFLSHKTIDKPRVKKYYDALKELGFDPWLDKPDMPAGTNLARALQKGFEESCAAVFFVTENFKDEKYLAKEVDYAERQKMNKGDKFSIIVLRLDEGAEIPKLFETLVYVSVENDLGGLYEVIRALPIELGPVRWKENVAS